MKTLQTFSDNYLEQCREMNTEQIVQFLDDFRRLHADKQRLQNPQQITLSDQSPSKLISIKIPQDLLTVFKLKAAMTETPYQSKIKSLMKNWVLDEG